jgi:hypothetical protein
MKKTQKHYEDMSGWELARATKDFNKPFAFERARPMTPYERAQERRLRRGRQNGAKHAKKISISMEGKLLDKTDALAKKIGVNRSELIADFVAAGLRRKAI